LGATPTCLQDQRIEFRVGIHQGDIIIEDGDIFSDGVNYRREGLAELRAASAVKLCPMKNSRALDGKPVGTATVAAGDPRNAAPAVELRRNHCDDGRGG
jgi:class 3 adenylate cyclase